MSYLEDEHDNDIAEDYMNKKTTRKMKKIINITGQIELTYDENSEEFKQTLIEYRECIDQTATTDDMLKHVAFHVNRFGFETMVEGVGYVGYNGWKNSEEPYSGIMVGEDYDEFDFEI